MRNVLRNLRRVCSPPSLPRLNVMSMHIHLYRSSCGLLHVCPCPIHVHVHVHVHVFMYVTMQACARRAPQPPAAHPLLALRDLRLAHPFWHDSLYKSITCPPRDYVASALRVRRFCMGLISCMIHRVQDTAILCIGCAYGSHNIGCMVCMGRESALCLDGQVSE